MGVMAARRLVLGVLVSVCALGCVLVGGAGSAWAAGGSFLFGPPGDEAGQLNGRGSAGMAVNSETGDIYVSDSSNSRMEKFGRSGEFLLAWGSIGSGAGEFDSENVEGVAVDNEANASRGDVFVIDSGHYRVQEFSPEGKFLRMFGGHVNRNGSNVCVSSEEAECQAGTQGEGNGEFEALPNDSADVAVGPGGDVYVGDKARVQVFEPSGVWKESISLSALSHEGVVTALAVNALGDVFVKVEGVPGVHGFEPNGLEMLAKFDEGSETVESIALGASGDLFVSENKVDKGNSGEPCVCDFKEYGPAGEPLASFGGHILVYMASGMVFDEALKELLTYGTDDDSSEEYGHYGVWGFVVPPPGPVVEAGSEKVTAEPRGAALFEGLVDPEGHATEVSFEYVDEADFKASGYASATSTAPVLLAGSGFGEEQVQVALPQKTLAPGVTYHWRIVAHNASGSNPGEDQSFEEIPPAYVEGPWATSVTATSVTLSANIDPIGANTTYRLEYGTSSSYGHVLAGSVGEGTGYVGVNYHVQGLEPNTIYHYRVVSESEVGVTESTDHTFTTQLGGSALTLPDGRAWELVSPPDKGGALIEAIEQSQAASDGSGVVYTASEPLGEGIVGHVGNTANTSISGATVLSRRGADGWRTHDISPAQTLLPEGQNAFLLFGAAEAYTSFSPDLSLGLLEPRFGLGHTQQSKEATEPTLYMRNNTSETYAPLVTAANVPSGTKWAPNAYVNTWESMSFEAATPDLSHILFTDWAPLTPEALTEQEGNFDTWRQNLYEWSGGKLQLVNILPDGKTQPGASFGTGAEGGYGYPNPWAMSSDGRWIVFRYNQINDGISYVRDMVEHKTVPFGRPDGKARFQTMSRDGSKLFYIEPESGSKTQGEQEGELYMLDPATGATTDLTAKHLDGERSAAVQNMVMGASEDGSYVYFVARGVLASGATRGQDNLYLLHYNGSEWTTTFVATLSGEDEKDWDNSSGASGSEIDKITSRVAPDGRYVTFMSDRPLTGYDNRDARSGQPDEEVYLYDAEAKRLVCASCNPSGARPVGVFDSPGNTGSGELLMDQSGAWAREAPSSNHWLAGVIAPDWQTYGETATHRADYLSNSGRLFFNSSDALVPQDTNGLADVYEYEPPGVGDCTSSSATFSERSGGCVSLVSSGQSSSESTFLDASESGDDVFFITAAKLVGEDYDTANDVYDAHVCTTALPCRTEPVSPPACTSGDSCKAAPSPQPEIFGPAPSATFNGAGNVLASPPSASAVKPRSLTRAQKLSAALKACRKKGRRKRVACERQARKRYGAKQSRNAKAIKKGNG